MLGTIARRPATKRAASTALPRVAPTRYLDLPDGRIAYDVTGDGPLVLMLPGLGDLRQEYRLLAPLVARAGYKAVTVDLRGHGESSVGWPTYDAASVGGDVLALATHLGGRAFVVGNSFSAAAAVWAATEQPEAVTGLALLGPFVRPQPQSRFAAVAVRALFAGPWRVGAWAAYHATLFKGARPADYASYNAALRENLAEPGRFEALAALMFRAADDTAERLGSVRTPSVVVMGAADPDFSDPEREAREVAATLGGGCTLLAGVGHYPQAEAPEATLGALLPALREAFGG